MAADSCTRALFPPMDSGPLAKTSLAWARQRSRFISKEIQTRRLVDSSWMRDGHWAWFSLAAAAETGKTIKGSSKLGPKPLARRLSTRRRHPEMVPALLARANEWLARNEKCRAL